VALLEIRDLRLGMRSFEGEALVLNGVSLAVDRGEVWGLVGETGCGKSLTGLSISRLVPPGPARYRGGQVIFDGQDMLTLPDSAVRALRGRRIGMIFQDPTTNLNPAFRVSTQMVDVALHAGAASRRDARARAIAMLDRVGIVDAAKRVDDYPHQFSGGMRQRVLIAMALLGGPDLLVADEPTTALDVSVQAQILRLLYGLVREEGLAVLLITHNLGVVAQICSHVAVMYAGNVVETAPVRAIFRTPRHPYTRALLAALPSAEAARGALRSLPGQVPDLYAPPPGCRFAPRCDRATAACSAALPPAAELAPGHHVACLHPH
jgi:oligopeptide/dipeptide ABC transporter ATP-binding protein